VGKECKLSWVLYVQQRKRVVFPHLLNAKRLERKLKFNAMYNIYFEITINPSYSQFFPK
jgi:hypothetical protein